MRDTKSYAGFVLGVLKAQLVDCALQYPELTKEFDRDYLRLSSAIECHGIRFFLDTMPAYRKHFDKCLDERRLTNSALTHFGPVHSKGTIPRLFRGLILRVFDHDGTLKVDIDINAIRCIRQLLGVVRKLRVTSNTHDTCESIDEFYQIDENVDESSLNWDNVIDFDSAKARILSFSDKVHVQSYRESPSSGDHSPVDLDVKLTEAIQLTADIVASLLGSFDPRDWHFRHGPGAVSDQRFDAYKYDFKTWPERLERVFPYDEFGIANWSCVDPLDPESVWTSSFVEEIPARLCVVPKTLSKPRLIACEPTCLQWTQQSIRDYFYDRVKHTMLGAYIDFRRQELNADLATHASIDGLLSTIDLSSASDRISCWVVERLFRCSPSLLDALQATRSVHIKQDICESSPKLHKLRKYSTMGNATTFPVQSILFCVFALASVCFKRKMKVNLRNLQTITGKEVRVFGDDIVIPTDCSGTLMEVIHAFGLKVNTSKSFTVGNFRESCGTDAFLGSNVTTVNVMDLPERTAPGSVVSSVDVHNNLCDKGWYATARFIQKAVEQETAYAIRTVDHGSGLFGWSSRGYPIFSLFPKRYNKDYQRLEERALTLCVETTFSPSGENAAMLHFFNEAPNVITSASSTLGHHTQRPKAKLRLRWVPVE